MCKTRRLVENGFGILTQKWPIFFRPNECKVGTTVKIVKVACILHNFLRFRKSDERFNNLTKLDLDQQEQPQRNLLNLSPNRRRASNASIYN